MTVSQPFTIDRFLQQVGEARGRPIVVLSIPDDTSAAGLAVSMRARDYVAVSDATGPLHRQHITFHEIAHLLLGHRGTPGAPEAITVARSDRSRHELMYSPQEEWAAESLATTVAELAAPSLTTSSGWKTVWDRLPGATYLSGRILFHRLYPLWRALVECQPRIAFEGPPPETVIDRALPVTGAWRALYRRVIEIYDGMRLISRHVDPLVVGSARRLAVASGVDLSGAEAVGTGAGLAAATRCLQGPALPNPRTVGTIGLDLGGDLMSHASVLAEVADAFAQWPLISGGSVLRPARRSTAAERARSQVGRHVGELTNHWSFDTSRASAARMYDFYLGGSNNFPADRMAACEAISSMPLIPAIARANRAFLQRAVQFLAEQGVQQFLDIGSGIPTMGNVHEIAQKVTPHARIVYVDIDPLAVMHARQLLDGNPLVHAIEGDLLRPNQLLHQLRTDPNLTAVIDLNQPIALILASVLHFVPDDDHAYGALDVLRNGLVPGSWLVITHGAAEGFSAAEAADVQRVYQQTRTPGGLRNRQQIRQFFGAFELVDPGLVWIPEWGNDRRLAEFAADPRRSGMMAGVAFHAHSRPTTHHNLPALRPRRFRARRTRSLHERSYTSAHMEKRTGQPTPEERGFAVGTEDESTRFDTGRATAARMYDYYLGGTTNFAADRAAAQQVIEQIPLVPAMARTHRAALARTVRFLAQQGVRQFLDIGSGVPTMGNVHQIAQQIAPEARTLYVDIDPVAVLHARQLLDGNDLADAIEGDLRKPQELLRQVETSPELAAIIDLTKPVALILACVLHFIPDDAEAYRVMEVLSGRLALGSWLVISHASRESYTSDQVETASHVYKQATATPGQFRSREQVLRFFGDAELVEPGLVWTPQWRPAPDDPNPFNDQPHKAGLFIGVGQVPAR